MYWTSGSGRIELNITKAIAASCTHPGPCDTDVQDALRNSSIARQVNKYTNDQLANELREYGAWSEEDLQNYDENKQRIVWIACGDIMEGR